MARSIQKQMSGYILLGVTGAPLTHIHTLLGAQTCREEERLRAGLATFQAEQANTQLILEDTSFFLPSFLPSVSLYWVSSMYQGIY